MRRHGDRAALFAAAGLVLVATLGIAACKQGNDRAQATAATGAAIQAEAVFNVQGMHCVTCPLTVRTAAKGVVGVVDAQVSMDEARAWVTYDPQKTAPAAIAQAITDSGYPATVVGAPSSLGQPSSRQ
jgi:mercuric ion binding protein